MDPLSILIWTAVWAGVSAGIYAVVYFANLTFEIIIGWFQKFAYLLVQNDRRSFQNRDYIAATITQAVENRDYNVVECIFDNKNKKVYDARVMKAGSVDTTIKQAHSYGRKEVAFWQ